MAAVMASLKSSRSKATNPAATHLQNGSMVPNGGHVLKEALSVFESETFEENKYVEVKCQSMNEKGIRKLCEELLELKKDSAEEMRRSVYANYAAFIRTSREISDLESELLSMRNLLSTQATLIHTLAEVQFPSLRVSEASNGFEENGLVGNDVENSEVDKHAQALPDIIDVYLAERKVEEVLLCLEEGEKLISDGATGKNILTMDTTNFLENALTERRVRLAEQLTQAVKQPSIRGTELRAAITALYRLGDGPGAHTLLLNSHHERLQHNMRSLRPTGSSYGGAFTAALSQLVFSTIAQAARDSAIVFGEQPAYASELVLWAQTETEKIAMLIKKHVLSSSAASGGLRAAAESVQIVLGHCSLLEAEGLALCPVLSKLLKPSVEQALAANINRIEESISVLAAAEDWVLAHSSVPTRSGMRTSVSSFAPHKLSISAHRFNSMIQDFMDDVAPLVSMHLAATTLDGVAHLFESYISMLIRAMPASLDDENEMGKLDTRPVKLAQTEAQQLALLGNAAALADELIPRASLKLLPTQKDEPRVSSRRLNDKQAGGVSRFPEQRDLRRRLTRALDKLRNTFCQQHALDLIYGNEEAEPLFSAEMYIKLDNSNVSSTWHQNPMASPFFQALYDKVRLLLEVAADVLPGKDRIVTQLAMRFTETILVWLSDDQDFWEDIVDGPRPLGPIGLQQFMLDMQFVSEMAKRGHYSSRHMRQVIGDIISRAIEAFAASGLDPDSILPDDNWFVATAEDIFSKLSPKETGSPTASISTHSVSSFRSHGSP